MPLALSGPSILTSLLETPPPPACLPAIPSSTREEKMTLASTTTAPGTIIQDYNDSSAKIPRNSPGVILICTRMLLISQMTGLTHLVYDGIRALSFDRTLRAKV